MQELYVIFDGGNGASREKEAYGSFKIRDGKNGAVHKLQRVTFGTGYTNNDAEYMTLIAALEYIIEHYKASDIWLTIEGDSELVRCQVGTAIYKPTDSIAYEDSSWVGWNVKEQRLLPLRDKARGLLLHFLRFNYHHIPRREVVAALGH